jgi:hypothetical protein
MKVTETGGYEQEMSVCHDCRIRRLVRPLVNTGTAEFLTSLPRKTEWDAADIVIRHIDSNAVSKSKPIITYSRSNGSRKSTRLQQIKEVGKRRHITVRKSTTVKEIKIMVGV